MSHWLPLALASSRMSAAHGVARRGRGLRENFERDGEQRVAREDGDAFAEDLVRGRPAAAEVVVVHAREVVVDERVGVDALDGAGGGEWLLRPSRRRLRRRRG